MINDPERLYEAWNEWVEVNLGRDRALGAAAARAATDAALTGSGFEGATAAAREVWRSESQRIRESPPSAMPLSLIAAMTIAIGGGVVSVLATIWFNILFGSCDDGICSYVGSVAALFVLFNLSVVAVNGVLLYMMYRRSRGAWVTTLVLVILGALSDGLGQLVPEIPTWYVNLGAFFLALYLNLSSFWLHLSEFWLLVHLFTIQLPILVLLLLRSSRRWFWTAAVDRTHAVH